MKKIGPLLLMLCALALNGQNWTVFNPHYRYNYKQSGLANISHVIFADSFDVTGPDTTWFLNRIVLPVKFSPPTYQANQPQFLQRQATRYSTGVTVFSDPKSFYFPASTVPGASWTLSPTPLLTATCGAQYDFTIWGIADSVREIVCSNSDTILLSKSFGLLRYNYYLLQGIEKSDSYDSTALFGEKVPNAWDFYDFQVGDVISYHGNKSQRQGFDQVYSYFSKQFSIVSKTITATGYIYSADMVSFACENYGPGCHQYSYWTGVLNFDTLNSPWRIENRMYPNMLLIGHPEAFYNTAYLPFCTARCIISSLPGGVTLKSAGTLCGQFPATPTSSALYVDGQNSD